MREIKKTVSYEIRKIATKNLKRKLRRLGRYEKINMDEYEELLEEEITKLEGDAKKIGLSAIAGFAFHMLIGF